MYNLFARLGCFVIVLCFTLGETKYCMPDESCWPSKTSLVEFSKQLGDNVFHPNNYNSPDITPGLPYYQYTYNTIMNRRWLVKPGMIALVQNEGEIQKCIKFARQYSIRISVISSGHDFIGRNTAAGSLQINLSKLNTIAVDVNDTADSPAGTVTVGAGTNWRSIYQELDSYNRVVVGGNSPLVSPGGYTLGGGHSPLTRKFGLAVDNVIWIRMVTADGEIVHVTKDGYTLTDENGNNTQHNDQDLFWALRGGGGGTFGVATKFKYKIHFPAVEYTSMYCTWAFTNTSTPDWAKDFLNFFNEAQQQLTDEWGGYLILTTPIAEYNLTYGGIQVFFTYWGNYSAAYESSAMFRKYTADHPERAGIPCIYQNYSTFWERQKNINDTSYSYKYIFSINIEPKTWSTSFSEQLADAMWIAHENGGYLDATGTLVGRKSRTFPHASSSVIPSFRNADMTMTFGLGYYNKSREDFAINTVAKPVAQKLYKLVDGGYLNEPDSEKEDWKTFYWGSNYDRLASIKRKWDPDNIFTCRHCVEPANDVTTTSRPTTTAGAEAAMSRSVIVLLATVLLQLSF